MPLNLFLAVPLPELQAGADQNERAGAMAASAEEMGSHGTGDMQQGLSHAAEKPEASRQRRGAGNVHTLWGDKQDEGHTLYWNGNSTQFDGDEKK